jgi:undecaprenyl diphosphate synthase
MELLSQYLDSELDELHANDIRFQTIGDVTRLPSWLAAKIEAAKDKTSNNSAMTLNIALSYGGRQDILQATLRLFHDLRAGNLTEESVSEQAFEQYLETAGLPDPDLLIRTGGELRISNFLLWQSAYTELYFTDLLWPDFDEKAFAEAVEVYSSRQRRYGMTSEQVEAGGKGS